MGKFVFFIPKLGTNNLKNLSPCRAIFTIFVVVCLSLRKKIHYSLGSLPRL
jgi:hypothetical protein